MILFLAASAESIGGRLLSIRERLVPILTIAVALAACATSAPIDRSLEILVAPDTTSPEAGAFEVILVNRTGRYRCVRREALELPGSNSIHAVLRVANRPVPFLPEGYLVDPGVYGMRPLAPGETVSVRTHFRGRFVRDFASLGRDAEVRVSVTHFPCSPDSPDATVGEGQRSWSRWTTVANAERKFLE